MMHRNWFGRALALSGPLCAVLFMMGCATYQVPGLHADFRALGITDDEARSLTDADIQRRLDRRPLAGFPAVVAVVRVQGSAYRSTTAQGFGTGNFTIVTVRDVEQDEDFERISSLPMLAGLVPLNRLVVPSNIRSERDLRDAAANVQADMLLLYTFDTVFGSESRMAPLSTFTLGLFPEREARVTSTVSAALIDTRNGYVYGLAEATSNTTQLANAWTSRSAVDQSRRRAEREAFVKSVAEMERMWHGVVARMGIDVPAS